ncbi:MAG: ArsA family ATPase [Bdellovibrionales bacterium]|nr:ArsA family ATPase [Bdellovibrionales bacterium]
MKPQWKEQRIFLIGGPGGVGKTTVAAALGVSLALEGYKTVVLTVDPAKRLAQALGFKNFTSDLQAVSLPQQKETKLFASMLDTQRYFDKIITRFAASERQRDKILNNRLYRIMVESLGGSHEYAAMERLLEFTKDTSFEKIIVDTPPSQNALDLLNAPQKLADFMDNSVLSWFQNSKTPFSLFRQGTRMAMKVLEKLFGSDFFKALAEVMDDLEGMHKGFRDRNLEVLALLKSDTTGFFLVTYPSEIRFSESQHFIRVLKEKRIPLSGVILNRIEPAGPLRLLDSVALPKITREEIEVVLRYRAELVSQQQYWLSKFNEAAGTLSQIRLEKRTEDIHDLETLSQIGKILVS